VAHPGGGPMRPPPAPAPDAVDRARVARLAQSAVAADLGIPVLGAVIRRSADPASRTEELIPAR